MSSDKRHLQGRRFASKSAPLKKNRSIARSSIFQALLRLDKISINAPAHTYYEYLESEIEINSSDRERNACTGGGRGAGDGGRIFEHLRERNPFEYQRQSKIDIGVTLYPVESYRKRNGGLKRKRINSLRD